MPTELHSSVQPETAERERVRSGSDNRAYTSTASSVQPDDDFIRLVNAYRDSGGIAGAPELLSVYRRIHGPDLTLLARWIVERQVLCFEWQQQTWFPWFQFERPSLVPHPPLHAVLQELAQLYDNWEIASWLVSANPGLDDRTPIIALAHDLPEVLQAARAESFVARV